MAALSLLFPVGGYAIVKPRCKVSGGEVRSNVMRCACSVVDNERGWSGMECAERSALFSRRNVVGASGIFIGSRQAKGAGLLSEEKPRLCDDICEKELENVWYFDDLRCVGRFPLFACIRAQVLIPSFISWHFPKA